MDDLLLGLILGLFVGANVGYVVLAFVRAPRHDIAVGAAGPPDPHA